MAMFSHQSQQTPLQKIEKILFFICLLGWSFFQFYRAHYFYALTLVILVLFFYFKRKVSYVALIVFIVMLVIMQTKVFDAWAEIREEANNFFENPRSVLANLFTPDSGTDTFTLELQDTVALTRQNNIESYRFSTKIAADDELVLPIYDTSFPARFDETSPYIFMFNDEVTSYPECKTIDDGRYITLGYCD